MVKVDLPSGLSFYMDGHLDRELDVIKSKVLKDDDRVFIVDGGERKGKSVFAMQLAARLDPNFDLSRVCFTAEEFIKAVKDANRFEAVVFDEAFTGLSSRTSLSRVNNLIVSLMMEMGQKNLFVIIVMPSIFFLERYVVLFRANGLFHVYTSGGKRGRWMFFRKESLKFLYLNGKKFYTYSGAGIPRSNFKGRFYEQYVVDEGVYRLKKLKNLEAKSFKVGVNKLDFGRSNRLLWCMSDNWGLSSRELEDLISRYDVRLSFQSIARNIKKVKEEVGSDS